MSDFKIELNREGVRALLRSPEMLALCRGYAASAQARCGKGYKMDARTGKNRVNAMVWASTRAAVRDNAQNNTLLKALR